MIQKSKSQYFPQLIPYILDKIVFTFVWLKTKNFKYIYVQKNIKVEQLIENLYCLKTQQNQQAFLVITLRQ